MARLLDRTIMRSASQRSGAVPPIRSQTSSSFRAGRVQANRAAPGWAESNSLRTGTAVSGARCPAASARWSATSTATFIVLAA